MTLNISQIHVIVHIRLMYELSYFKGVGLDDMFILLSGLSDAPFDKSPEERVAETMRTSGVAITITSVTDVIAFGIGASSVFLSVRNFCIYTGNLH